jgi:integrase
MPKLSRGPHLYLKKRSDGANVWYIRDARNRISTGYGESDIEGAREALGVYIARTAKPDFGDRDPHSVKIASIIALYAQDRRNIARPNELAARLTRLLDYFGNGVVDEITPSSCAAYVRHRGTEQGARRELEDLRAAIRHAFHSRKLAVEIPVALPDKAVPRDRWLTRSEAARLLAGALGWRLVNGTWRRDGQRSPHVARFILLGLYTATRHDALLGLAWRVHTGGGHVDLERGVLYRAPPGTRQTKKRRPPVSIPPRLLAHLNRWAHMPAAGLYIVTFDGSRLAKMKRAWATARRQAGLDAGVTPHVLRHTAITWRLHDGWSIWDVAGFAGATTDVIESVYGHHAETFGHRKNTGGRF